LILKYQEFVEIFEIKMESKTTGIVKRFYYMDDEVHSIVRKKDFQTLFFKKKIREKKREKEEISIFFPEEKMYFYKYLRYLDTPFIDSLSIFYFIRINDNFQNPIKVYDRGKFYETFIKEEKDHLYKQEKEVLKVDKLTLLRKDKKSSYISVYVSKNEDRIPLFIEFSFPLGILKAVLQCY
ncbi:MAG: DUF3108 domain-containing protein, partial [Thermoanaerobaculia bacterium]